jgi:hypothetical protein
MEISFMNLSGITPFLNDIPGGFLNETPERTFPEYIRKSVPIGLL